jgi:hypothetical protein
MVSQRCGCRFWSFGLGLKVQVAKKMEKQNIFIVVSKAV